MTPKIQKVLELLSDGKLHRLEELQMHTGLSEKQARAVAEFLIEFGFAEATDEGKEVRISKSARELLVPTA